MQDRFGGVQVSSAYLALAKARSSSARACHTRDDLAGQFSHLGGQFGQDAADLVPFGDLGFAVGVVQLHHRQRLDEQGGAGGGLVVDDGLDLALELGPQGDDIAPVRAG